MQPENDLIYIYGIFQYLDFQLLYLLFAAIPGAALFCADWENRFIRFSAQRCSKRIYGVSKGIACFVSAVLVVTVIAIAVWDIVDGWRKARRPQLA